MNNEPKQINEHPAITPEKRSELMALAKKIDAEEKDEIIAKGKILFEQHEKKKKFDFEKNGDVHTAHCCIAHGCKYSDEDCPVATGKKPQEHTCEICEFSPDPKVVKALQENSMTLDAVKTNLARRFGKKIHWHHSAWGDDPPPATVQITIEEYKAIESHLHFLEGAKEALEESENPFYRGAGIITQLCQKKGSDELPKV